MPNGDAFRFDFLGNSFDLVQLILGKESLLTDEGIRLLESAVEIEKPTEEAVLAEWTRDPSRFRAPPLWEVSHILIACDPRDEDATEKAIEKASKSVKGIRSVWVKDFSASVDSKGKIDKYRVTVKVTFEIKD